MRLVGRGDPELDARLRTLLQRPDLVLVPRDTLIAYGDTVRGTLVMLGGRLLLEGVVEGALLGVEADLFLRPDARIRGDLLNVAGGLYPSALAHVEGEVVDEPLAPYLLRRVGGVWIIEGRARERRLVLHGPAGLGIPTYDRVSGLSLRAGASYFLPTGGRLAPRVSAFAVYRSARGALEGGVEAAADYGFWTLALGAERTTVTNEHWIRSPFTNSLAFAFKGSDYFDYHRSDRLYARVERELTPGAWSLTPWVGIQREEVESLRARNPWVLLSPDSVRPNPLVDDGWIRSLRGGVRAAWASERSSFQGSAELEAGSPEDQRAAFARFAHTGEWDMQALFGHRLELEWHFLAPLPGTERVPERRWSFVGDIGTLRTLEAPFRGDRLAFVETVYVIPLPPRLRLPLLGVPDLELLHEIGMAWTADERLPLEQNVGARLQYSVLFLRVITNPEDPGGDLKLDVGVSSPF